MPGRPARREHCEKTIALLADPAAFAEILEAARCGVGLHTWVVAKNVPYGVVRHWIQRDPRRAADWEQARAEGAHFLVEDALRIVDANPERRADGSIDPAGVSLMKHRSDARRWLAGRLLPTMYSDSINIESRHNVSFDLRGLLDKREARLREPVRIFVCEA